MNDRSPYANVEFAPYDQVPVGKELVRGPGAGTHAGSSAVIDGQSYLELSLWMNSAMEDQGRWDGEVRAVHGLLSDADPLDDDARVMRLQIASCEACHYRFPGSLFTLLATVGQGDADRELQTGCDAQFGPMADKARRARIEAHAAILSGWAEGKGLGDSVRKHPRHANEARRIHEMLGERTHRKTLYVRRLALLIGLISQEGEGYPYYSDRCCYPQAAEIDREILAAEKVDPALASEILEKGMALRKGPDRQPFRKMLAAVNPILEKISHYDAVSCRSNLFRHFDIWVSSIGCGTWRGAMPRTNRNRRRIERAVANLTCALNGWLAGADPAEAAAAWPDARETCERVDDLLGPATPAKRYLAALLWKRLKSQKGRRLIDENPESFRATWIA